MDSETPKKASVFSYYCDNSKGTLRFFDFKVILLNQTSKYFILPFNSNLVIKEYSTDMNYHLFIR